jgi:uncharacterized cupin superfamily protein
MATILKCDKRDFQEDPHKIDSFRLYSDVSRIRNGIRPKNLNFDLRLLNPGQFSAPYHFHRYAEELFMLVSGSMTMRTPDGLELITSGDMVFFEMGETGAHQFYNHGIEPCIYLDIRTFIGFDICEYPDSGKILIAPSYEIFNKESTLGYFEGEKNILEKWNKFKNKTNDTIGQNGQ